MAAKNSKEARDRAEASFQKKELQAREGNKAIAGLAPADPRRSRKNREAAGAPIGQGGAGPEGRFRKACRPAEEAQAATACLEADCAGPGATQSPALTWINAQPRLILE